MKKLPVNPNGHYMVWNAAIKIAIKTVNNSNEFDTIHNLKKLKINKETANILEKSL